MNHLGSLCYEHLVFVSESDSVLCSYIYDQLGQEDRYGMPEKYVLIYDMGAGTLDLTYASFVFNREGRCTVKVLGRSGIFKAGNYIDYLLGEIICHLLKEKGCPDKVCKSLERLLSLDYQEGVDFQDRKNFKNYLRNKVKIALSSPDTTQKLPHCTESADERYYYKILSNSPSISEFGCITIKEILEHPLFTGYIESCTETAIGNLAHLYDSSQSYLKIDTVIMSGRSSSMSSVQHSLFEAVKSHNTEGENFEKVFHDDPNDLKVAVAKGALNYVLISQFSNHTFIEYPVYGCYGLLLIGIKRPERWIKMIDKDSLDLSWSDYIALNDVVAINLCSSFEADTLRAAQESNYDSITVIHSYHVPKKQKGDVRISFSISADKSLTYKINQEEMELEPHDDYANSSLRQSLWPVIYNV